MFSAVLLLLRKCTTVLTDPTTSHRTAPRRQPEKFFMLVPSADDQEQTARSDQSYDFSGTPATDMTKHLGAGGGWPTQARFWLEWGSSTAGQSLPATLSCFCIVYSD